MKWQAALAGALASALVAAAASAEVRVVNDPGGEVSSYLHRYEGMRDSGERLVIDGPCLSACTLFTGLIPRDHVCVTRRAVLGFHAASYYDDARRSLVPTRAGTRLVMRLYPAGNPRLDRPAWRPDPASQNAPRPRTRGALQFLPLTRRAHCPWVPLSLAAFRHI